MKPFKDDGGNVIIATSRSAEGLLHDNLSTLDHEEAWLIYLTSHNKLIGTEMVSKGTLDKTAIDSRTILRQALLHNAASIYLLHNHPSGDCTPSQGDIRLTGKIRQACQLLEIPLVDHIIVGGEYFYSFYMEKSYRH